MSGLLAAARRITAGSGRRAPVQRALRAVPQVLGLLSWQAGVVTCTSGLAAAGLWWLVGNRVAAGLEPHSTVLVAAATTWSLIALVTAAVRRMGQAWSGVVIVAVITSCLLQGLTFPSTSLRWVTLACLMGVPQMAMMLLRRSLVAPVCVACTASATVIAVHLQEPDVVRAYAAVTVPLVVSIPTIVMSVLLSRLESARALADRQALTDPLTELANRRGLRASLPALTHAAGLRGHLLTLAIADADHFKAVNDEHGHQVGDTVLVRLAAVMRQHARREDVLARLGGEEVAWVSIVPTPEAAQQAAERLRAAVQDWREPGLPTVTVSIGVAVAEPAPGAVDAMLDDLYRRADQALYAAKSAGRNRVGIAAPRPGGGQVTPPVRLLKG